MHFNHDNMTGALLAADLVSTAADNRWSPDGLHRALAAHDIRRPTADPSAVEALRQWTGRLRSVFAADSAQTRCEAVNVVLADGAANVYLTMHDDLRPHLHFASEESDLVGRVRAVTAGGLALFTVESGGTRLGLCQREGCERAYVDTSRNGRRRYCSTRCANGDAVRRHRTAARSAAARRPRS
ncbi:Conserved protein containing a Zn-ribbon-like motif, possibly RNA-binding [Rhodococcoides kroppenstedtii]|uniref:Conserved protein containing a Zn-ribbon-like motif, possibly RNA-binding n=1 Tax=Rhodococcoides kroppenstedtii TaxID=293050 RepID=A0A1I0SQC4_9NOCA|nr:CGNR zinc finger domain-containing protein [Rhodococcus kroppenstedtii]SFA41728.1 Conserved protein containing a Zn-ribbon-like motif, possibly RNA-binding [Rhodococcus kroppenstedtii]